MSRVQRPTRRERQRAPRPVRSPHLVAVAGLDEGQDRAGYDDHARTGFLSPRSGGYEEGLDTPIGEGSAPLTGRPREVRGQTRHDLASLSRHEPEIAARVRVRHNGRSPAVPRTVALPDPSWQPHRHVQRSTPRRPVLLGPGAGLGWKDYSRRTVSGPRALVAPRRIGPLLALLFFALYALTSAGWTTSLDGGVMYDTARAIANNGTLALPPHHHGLLGVNGAYYSKYGVAQSLAEIPLFLLGRALSVHMIPYTGNEVTLAVTMLTNGVMTALAIWLFFLLAFELTRNVQGATMATLLLGIASPFWPYAKSDFSEPLSALALTGVVLFLVRARGRPTTLNFLCSGAFFALALLTKLTAVFVLPVLFIYALYAIAADRADGSAPSINGMRVRLALWATPIVGGLGVTAWYDAARYGHLTDTGYYGNDLPFHAPLIDGLAGLLLSPGKGLLWFCPLVLLALPLWPRLVRGRLPEALLLLGMAFSTLVVFATYPVWWGGFCWGPRYLVPALPFVLLPLALLPGHLPPPSWRRTAALSIVGLALVVQLLGVAVQPVRFPATGVSTASYLWLPGSSPLLGHAWMLVHDMVSVVNPTGALAMDAHYPWMHHDHPMLAASQRLLLDGWSYWWWAMARFYRLDDATREGVAILFLLLVAVALWGLRGARRDAARFFAFDRRHMAVRLAGGPRLAPPARVVRQAASPPK